MSDDPVPAGGGPATGPAVPLSHPEVLVAFVDAGDAGGLLVLRADGPGRALGWWAARSRPAAAGGLTVDFVEAVSASRAVYGGHVADQRAFFAAYGAALGDLVSRLAPLGDADESGGRLGRMAMAAHLELVADDMVEVLADIAEGVHTHTLDDTETITEPLLLYLDAFAAIVRARYYAGRFRRTGKE